MPQLINGGGGRSEEQISGRTSREGALPRRIELWQLLGSTRDSKLATVAPVHYAKVGSDERYTPIDSGAKEIIQQPPVSAS